MNSKSCKRLCALMSLFVVFSGVFLSIIWMYYLWSDVQWYKSEARNIQLVKWAKISLIILVLLPIISNLTWAFICCGLWDEHQGFREQEGCMKRCGNFMKLLIVLSCVYELVWGIYGIHLIKSMKSDDMWFKFSMIMIDMYQLFNIVILSVPIYFACFDLIYTRQNPWDIPSNVSQNILTYLINSNIEIMYGRSPSEGYVELYQDNLNA